MTVFTEWFRGNDWIDSIYSQQNVTSSPLHTVIDSTIQQIVRVVSEVTGLKLAEGKRVG